MLAAGRPFVTSFPSCPERLPRGVCLRADSFSPASGLRRSPSEMLICVAERRSLLLQVRGGGRLDRRGDGPHFERLAGPQEIQEQLFGERTRVVRAGQHQDLVGALHVHAGAVTDRYQADRLEALERFAHRWVSDAEAARHFHDGRQAIALLELPLLYQHPDLARLPIPQTLLGYGFKCVGQSCRPSFGGATSTTAANAGLGRPSRSNNNG